MSELDSILLQRPKIEAEKTLINVSAGVERFVGNTDEMLSIPVAVLSGGSWENKQADMSETRQQNTNKLARLCSPERLTRLKLPFKCRS